MTIKQLYQLYIKHPKISTDTRKLSEGSIFFALSGPNFNANEFTESAIEKGAAYAVISDENYKKDDRYIVVKNTLQTLQELANYHRKHLSIPIIGITGSNGKTTTKELMHAVLSQHYKTYATRGNLNNHIGVPLSVLEVNKEHEIAINKVKINKI
jgi:UDP-N-acetylmuramoyl-tripeptide--D-alanyl-D-alanine ligase